MQRTVRMGLLLLLAFGLMPLIQRPAQAATLDDQIIADEILVTFNDGYRVSANGAFFEGSKALKNGLGIGPLLSTQMLDGAGQVAMLKLPAGANGDAKIAQLLKNPAVRYAEYNAVREILVDPNDEYYSEQWGLPKIGANAAWDMTQGNGLVIAIIDTGVSPTHPDLAGHVLPGYNALQNNSNSQDDQGHGTAMAGIAAALTNNGQGVAGVCWNCQILPVKVLNSRGQGTAADIVEGMYWAADNGARIISMSLGGPRGTQAEQDAVNYIYSKNIPLFASSGNSGDEGNPRMYPAAFDHVIAVGATTTQDRVASFSSYGDYVDIAAPGVNIVTTGWDGGDTYEMGSGTSPACPFVAATAALALSVWPELTVDQIEKLITGSAVDILTPGKDVYSGFGRLDTYKTVQNAVLRTIPGEPQPQPPAPPAPQPPTPEPQPGNPAFVPVGAPPLPAPVGEVYFPETGHNLRGEFKNYWDRNGGLAVFGFPISEEFTEQTPEGSFTVQYFERQRFEFHPEKAAPYNVLLGRLGDAVLRDRGDDWANFPKTGPENGCLYFDQTQHKICGEFRKYWETNGLNDPALNKYDRSLQLFGLPLSEPMTETNRDGATVTTQWFERGRFEYHEGQGVLLGLLAKEYANNRSWR
ncbi:MAG TPA: peptidase S8 [Herpetosiphon sp.]|uniref:Peptidase S8 and S53 subtilisin kexin sedolisin n=1 Tax=Herpetosiphon aurantiacus (strain ATCC 23779 / DSM 785 / 114-95) TaxID=316274 RepID=A9B541_HERA2|nr:S8 family peptidase [Herpetosiphon sp.]ABX06178.1 peptidase S8 and S53 subtilisin kexin sedolisin [Herpetosiphon aurantiacus DSM 785]HBW51883.1 peptidase S8 [Herpetosiphon sp.]